MINLLFIVVAFTILAPLWVLAVRAYYAHQLPLLERFEVTTADGWPLVLHLRRAAHRRAREPVVLCHGLANNHRFFEFHSPLSVGEYLSALGFDCYSVDLRGIGGSATPPPGKRRDATVDDFIAFDVPAILDAVTRHSRSPRAFWVGHSMGGLIALGAADEKLQEKLQGLATLGAPVFMRFSPRIAALLRLAQKLTVFGQLRLDLVSSFAAPFAGWFAVPLARALSNPDHMGGPTTRRLLATVIAPISLGVLRQFERWAERGSFDSLDGQTDYRARLAHLRVPTLVVAGTADHLAPAEGCREAFTRTGSAQKAFLELEGFGHGDLVLSSPAVGALYPRLGAWLTEHATPAEASPVTEPASRSAEASVVPLPPSR